uniref:PAS domain S-box protein n=1 Tax=uncultured Rhizobium sp. TaxID=155567 RepID=UPI00263126B2|nr:PAS domain S-box protein [uncultured Rhizobium sp.]
MTADLGMSLADWMKMTPAMSHSIDSRGVLVAVSDSWLRKLGYERREVLGKRSTDFMPERSRERVRLEKIPLLFQTGRVENVEFQMICKDGSPIDVLLSAVLVRQGEDHVSISSFTDITQLRAMEQKLAESEAKYRYLVEYQSEMVSLAKVDGELLFVNRAYAEHHATTPEEMIGRSLYDFVPTQIRGELAQHMQHVAIVGEAKDIENQVLSPDGKPRWVSWTNKAFKDEDGIVTAIHSVGKHVDARVDAETKLRESEERYRLLAENSTDMVFQLDAGRAFTYVSPAGPDILGHALEDLDGRCLYDLVHPQDAEPIRAILCALASGELKRHGGVHRFLHRDGHPVWVEMQVKALGLSQIGSETGIVGTLRDFSVHKRLEERLRDANLLLAEAAATDGLTGLMNRRAFDQAFQEAFEVAKAQGQELGLILTDVDYFKAYNDHYGHSAGDECLKTVSAILRSVAESCGYHAARYGGEEFCIILPGASENTTFLAAERMRLAMQAMSEAHAGSPSGFVSISLGLATLSQSGVRDRSDLLNAADRALYRAKASGRNTVVRASYCEIEAEREPRVVPNKSLRLSRVG